MSGVVGEEGNGGLSTVNRMRVRWRVSQRTVNLTNDSTVRCACSFDRAARKEAPCRHRTPLRSKSNESPPQRQSPHWKLPVSA